MRASSYDGHRRAGPDQDGGGASTSSAPRMHVAVNGAPPTSSPSTLSEPAPRGASAAGVSAKLRQRGRREAGTVTERLEDGVGE